MNAETTQKLLALNRAFYAAFARPFAGSRSLTDPALTAILPYIPPRARVLDRERPGATYIGIDAVPELIEVARTQTTDLNVTSQFHIVDITRPDWSLFIGSLFIDTVVCLAVLHHIPGFDLRAQVLREIAGLLASNGCLILSTWQFLDSPRLRRKIAPWLEAGIAEETLEPGDYLLDWRRGGRGYRYCHLVDEAGVERLAAASGFCVRETFRAGGREGGLSLFAILDPYV